MSKQLQADDERIPSYEESTATSPNPIFPNSTSLSTTNKVSPRQTIQQRSSNERLRRITTLITHHLDPAITTNLENGITKFVLVLLPSNTFAATTSVSEASITSPLLTLPTTLLSLRYTESHLEKEDDYRAPFLTQGIVIHDLTTILHQSLTGLPPTYSQPPASTPSLSVPTTLPPNPAPTSWFKRKFGLPPADHDPTGETGKWNLGWRSDEDPASTQAAIETEEMKIHTRLQDVSFRTENEMGLLESQSVKCVWLEIDLK